MRTTIDLPPELMQAAKIAAVERGMSLKDLFAKALTHEIGAGIPGRKHGRVTFPLVSGPDAEPKAAITNADIEAAFEAEDIEKYAQ
ncbi:hypothetical protein ACQPZ2_40875 [Nocardia pseudovaccinii]|uniref:hypothetical protein n=1 Tax=Nocardia pseudovaccinii TaxID=189540 RepID=UPI003D8C075E